MVGAGMLMGLRTTISMLVGALINYGVLAPILLDHGVIHTHMKNGEAVLGYRGVVEWSLWPGAAIMVTSGLLTFGMQWRTVLRAFSGLGKLLKKSAEHHDAASADPTEKARAELEKIEVPASWFVVGTTVATIGLVIIGHMAFGISPLLGVISVVMAFMLAIVACRATGETDITPVGAMGKITQLTYGVLAPTNITTNLMTASVTAGTAGASADLLNDLKSGYLLGANPRQQFLAQLSGTLVGTAVSVPVFNLLVPTPDALGTDRFPAPSAQVWKGVAELLAHGVQSLHPWARWGIVIGGIIGIILPLLELAFPKYKQWVPSATGLGLALVIPCFNSVSMFLGALIAYLWVKYKPEHGERYITPVASGIIAGESLLGVAVALLSAGGYLQ
jgi:OPT family oligopeptide transporter